MTQLFHNPDQTPSVYSTCQCYVNKFICLLSSKVATALNMYDFILFFLLEYLQKSLSGSRAAVWRWEHWVCSTMVSPREPPGRCLGFVSTAQAFLSSHLCWLQDTAFKRGTNQAWLMNHRSKKAASSHSERPARRWRDDSPGSRSGFINTEDRRSSLSAPPGRLWHRLERWEESGQCRLATLGACTRKGVQICMFGCRRIYKEGVTHSKLKRKILTSGICFIKGCSMQVRGSGFVHLSLSPTNLEGIKD